MTLLIKVQQRNIASIISRKYVLPSPDLCRCFAVKMLVWSYMVIPEAELNESTFELFRIFDLPLIQFPLQCPEEPFDSSVLPRAALVDTLMANTYQP